MNFSIHLFFMLAPEHFHLFSQRLFTKFIFSLFFWSPFIVLRWTYVRRSFYNCKRALLKLTLLRYNKVQFIVYLLVSKKNTCNSVNRWANTKKLYVYDTCVNFYKGWLFKIMTNQTSYFCLVNVFLTLMVTSEQYETRSEGRNQS